MKKKEFLLDLETFQNEMIISHAKTKLLEIEWVNQRLIELLFEERKEPREAILVLRDELYNRMESYKGILIKGSNKDEKFKMQ